MTIWYSAVLLISAMTIAGLSIQELHEQRDQTEDPAESSRDIVELMVAIGLPAVLLSVGGGWWLMRRAFAPVSALTQAAEHLTERNLAEKLPRSGNGDELDRLTEVLNAMTSRLNDSFLRTREFTLHASHELKTPLTVLCGETETEMREESLSPSQRERAASRLDELRRLARIVDGLSLLAKADAGMVPLAMAPVRLDDLVRDSFADAQILAHASATRVELGLCEPVTVLGDVHRLRQLLLNLADNAVKYNQPGGSISMALCRVNGDAEFLISNTGPGIAPELLPRVFDRFFRGDPSHSNQVEGCGLGLSIAQWIVTVHKGTIRVESDAGKLTTLTVRLPVLSESQRA